MAVGPRFRGYYWHGCQRPEAIGFRRFMALLGLWLFLVALGAFHIYVRFLTREIQLERRLLVKRQVELVKRQMELENDLALAQREFEEQAEFLRQSLGFVELDPRQRIQLELPRELVAKYLPEAPKRSEDSRSAFVNSAQAAPLEMPPLVQALVTVIEANREQARKQGR
ncbi:MAG: hypothetical protein N2Z21_01085 [Candidatus Sumerlaeaceae bacterium]|nr:hypothetical protein [Candidatus Sumerlaeaceae bacterium]